jgi:hypothetical protein
VLRGTSDLTDKGLRVVAALRLCLRMEEHDEYSHVLGRDPGKTELEGAKGAGYLRTDTISRPVLGRTVNVDLAGIDRHAVACGPLRPELDEYALRAAAKVTPAAVLGGREPAREHMTHRAMQDCKTGRAYEGRWERYAAKLAEMRGEEHEIEQVPAAAALASTPPASNVLDAWAAAVLGPAAAAAAPASTTPAVVESAEVPGGARIIPFRARGVPPEQPAAAPAPAPAADTAREQILTLVRDAGAEGIAAADVERGTSVSRSRVYALLKQLRTEGVITQNPQSRYVLSSAQTSAPSA